MKKKQEICLGLPEGLTGRDLKGFLRRSKMHFFTPKKKIKTSAEIQKLHESLHNSLMNDKLRSGRLIKLDPPTNSESKKQS
jgi:hypothetical protein